MDSTNDDGQLINWDTSQLYDNEENSCLQAETDSQIKLLDQESSLGEDEIVKEKELEEREKLLSRKENELNQLEHQLEQTRIRLSAWEAELTNREASLKENNPRVANEPIQHDLILEQDELEPPSTPVKSCPRPSIGQWSAQRQRNNMSVRKLVKTLERK